MPKHQLQPVLFLCLALLSLPFQASAQEIQPTTAYGEIAVSDESVQLRYIRPRYQPADNIEVGQLGFGLFLSEERDIVASANFYVEATRLRINRLSFMVGPVAYAALLGDENEDVFALALGAEARFRLLRNPRVDIVGQAVYAPDILTFGSADNVWDIVGRAEIPITDRVTGFGGFRLFEIDLLQGTKELEETIHLGLRYRF
ncbi:MAG TPA: hypothetical protein VKZ91_01330 [Woeseiaceae bacterium]|nr:hypothetical protein [Woeseiaceae bacterium]